MLKHHRRSSPGTSSASMSCCRRRPQLGMESPCSVNAETEGTDSAFAKPWRGQVTPGETEKKMLESHGSHGLPFGKSSMEDVPHPNAYRRLFT